jgi:hypothetical protein
MYISWRASGGKGTNITTRGEERENANETDRRLVVRLLSPFDIGAVKRN